MNKKKWSLEENIYVKLALAISLTLLLTAVGLRSQNRTVEAADCSTTTITVTQKSSAEFIIDDDTTPLLDSAYVAYQIQTGASGSFTDLWVQAQTFSDTTKLKLATNEDGLYHVGALGNNSSVYVYFYLTGAMTNSSQSYTLNLFNGSPNFGGTSTCTRSVSHTKVTDEIQAAANKVTSVVSTAPYIGGSMTITVKGDTGNMSSSRPEGSVFSYTPASLNTWPADCYELYDTQITLTGGNVGTYNDSLVLTGLNATDSGYTVVYSFIAACTTASPTSVTPVNYISSGGTNLKHTDTGTATYTAIPPVPPAENRIIMSKSVSPSGSVGGGTATYTLTLTNTAPISISLDIIQDLLPSSPATVTYVDGSSTFNGSGIANPNLSGQQLTWTGNYDVPANSSRTFTYQATIPANNGLYTNSAKGYVGSTQIDQTLLTSDNVPATVTYGVGDPNFSTSTKSVSDLNGGNVEPGDTLRYTVTVNNSGTLAATGVDVTDTIDTDTETLTNVVVAASGSNCGGAYSNSSSSTALNIQNIAVVSGGTCIITFEVSVKLTAADNAAILNTATITASDEGGVGGSPSSEPLSVQLTPVLVVTKTENDADDSVTPGQVVTYTITIDNTGEVNATGIDVLDTVTGAVSSITAITPTNCGSTYTDSSSGLNIDIANVDVATGTNCVITYQATVNAGATNGQTIDNAVNVGQANQGGNDPAEVNATTLTVGVVAGPTLSVTKTENDADNSVTPGLTVTYTVTITNSGSATGTTSFTDAIDADYGTPSNFNFTNCGGSHSSGFVAPTLTVSSLVVTTSNACIVAYDVVVDSPSNEGTSLSNSADVAAAAEGGNDPAPVVATTLTVDATPNMSTSTKSVSDLNAGTVIPGDSLRYTITLINSGNGQATSVSVSDTIDLDTENLTNVGNSNCGSPTDNSTSSLLDVTNITVAVGVNCVITFDVSVKTPRNEGTAISNTATVSAASEGGSGSTPSSTTLFVDISPSVTLASTDNDVDNTVDPSQSVTYTLVLTNSTAGDATVDVADTITGPSSSIGSVNFTTCGSPTDNTTGQALDITDLVVPANGNCTITYVVSVDDDALGGATITNNADATAPDEGGSNPTADSADTLTVTSLPAMEVSKSENDADNIVTPGQSITYTITIENTGNTTLTTTLVDTIPTGMGTPVNRQATDCGSTTDDYQAPSFNIYDITISVDDTCTITYDVSVQSPLNEDTTLTNAVDVAQADEGGDDPDDVSAVTLTVNATPNLSTSTKTVSDVNGDDVVSGDVLTYTITIINSGNGQATSVSVGDIIDSDTEDLTNVDTDDCGSPTDNSTSVELDISDITIEVGTPCVITFDVTVKEALSDETSVANTAVINAAIEGGVGATPSSTTVYVQVVVPEDDGIDSDEESAGPNDGDSNDDGEQDSEQNSVTTIFNPVTNLYTVLETDGCEGNSDVSIGEQTDTGAADNGFTYPVGLLAFSVTCATPGSTVTVAQYYFSDLDDSEVIARKYNSITHVYSTIEDAVISNAEIDGQPYLKIVYQLTDGSNRDEDGLANGTIIDPVGPALIDAVAGSPNTGLQAFSKTSYLVAGTIGITILVVLTGKLGYAKRKS